MVCTGPTSTRSPSASGLGIVISAANEISGEVRRTLVSTLSAVTVPPTTGSPPDTVNMPALRAVPGWLAGMRVLSGSRAMVALVAGPTAAARPRTMASAAASASRSL